MFKNKIAVITGGGGAGHGHRRKGQQQERKQKLEKRAVHGDDS